MRFRQQSFCIIKYDIAGAQNFTLQDTDGEQFTIEEIPAAQCLLGHL